MTSLIILLCLQLSTAIQSDPSPIKRDDLKVNGLPFSTTKEEVVKTFGEPTKTFQPKYECGFLSESEQGTKYYTLDYGTIKYTGNKQEGYLLENAVISSTGKINITYQGHTLTSQTTVEELESLFGVKLNEFEIKVPFKDADDALVFSIGNGKLIRVMYWSPC